MADLSASDFKPVQATDFKPVSSNDAGPSASDFKPVKATDFKPVLPTAPQANALPFDDVITREATSQGVPVQLALAIGRNETGGQRDRARATSPTGAVGVMQLEPGTAREMGVQNSTDPAQNIRGGIKYLKQLSDKYHGDSRAIAAAYNMGPGAYDEYVAGKRAMPKETADYIDKIATMPQDAPETHKEAGPSAMLHIQHVVDTFKRAQKAGKDPFKAIGRTSEMRGTAKLEHNGQASWKWLQNHPLEGLGDVLGAPQRVVGTLEANDHDMQHDELRGIPRTPEAALHGVWDAVINPTDKNLARATRGPLDELEDDTHGRMHFPTHKEIDDAIKGNVWVPQSLKGTISTLSKAGEDMSAQFVSDPFSLPGGLTEKGLNAAAGVARAVHGLMPIKAASNWLHLPQMAGAMEELGSKAFGVRRDLDAAGFTREGKHARIAMENAEMTKKAHSLEDNQRVMAQPQQAAEKYVNQIAEHGKGRTAVQAQQHPLFSGKATGPATGHAGPKPDFHTDVAELMDPATDPLRRKEILDDVSHSIFKNQLESKSTQFFGAAPHLFHGSLGALKTIGTEEASNVQKFLDSSPMKPLRDIGKKAITWNPAPHGLKNVGTMAYLAGGLPAVARGLAAMTHPPSPAEVKELEEMGALPKYLGAMHDPGGNPFQRAGHAIDDNSQKALERMELGWRYGLAKTLEKKLGVPVTQEEKLLRGWLINNKVGDYRNQSAFVKMFQALGGPFVAFRLGIVPAKVAEAMKSNPERLVAATRGQRDLQDNRDHNAQRQNEFTLGGPVQDEAEMFSNPGKYLGDTIGNVSGLGKSTEAGGKGLIQAAMNMAGSYIPGVSSAQEFGKDAAGTERPGQKVEFADQIMDSMLASLGMYYKKKMAPKIENKEYRQIRKGAI